MKSGGRLVRRKLKNGRVKTYKYPAPQTVGAVIEAYKKSPEYRALKPSSRLVYNRALDLLWSFDGTPIQKIRRKHVLEGRDELADKPSSANALVQVWQIILQFAVEREEIEHNPALKIRRIKTREYRRWPEEAVAFALGNLPERFRRAVMLGVCTGQRAGDIVKMKWGDYDGEGISVIQEKTGAELWVPAHPELVADLASWKRASIHLLVNSDGKPWAKQSFCAAFSTSIRQHQELNGLVFHGLRKTAASWLAECGCPAHEIQAITGHQSLNEVARYTREASQKVMAKAAMTRLASARKIVPFSPRKALKL